MPRSPWYDGDFALHLLDTWISFPKTNYILSSTETVGASSRRPDGHGKGPSVWGAHAAAEATQLLQNVAVQVPDQVHTIYLFPAIGINVHCLLFSGTLSGGLQIILHFNWICILNRRYLPTNDHHRRISVVLPFQEMFPIEEDRRYLPDHVPVSVCIVQPGILEHLPVQGRGRTVSESPIAVTDVAGGWIRFPDPDQSPE